MTKHYQYRYLLLTLLLLMLSACVLAYALHDEKVVIDSYTTMDLISIDPFSNTNRIARFCNDLDPQYGTDYNLDALDFLRTFETESVKLVLNDPPFSKRQLVETYKRLGKSVNLETTQQGYWRDIKEELSRIVAPGGKVISCGWSSGGTGKGLGFKITRILLVPHGAGHNDTIVVLDEKTQCKLTAFSKSLRINVK